MTQSFRPLLGSDLFADSFGYLNDTDLTLLTESAGAVQPANPVAYQIWVDTLTGLRKRRNAANDAWITEGVVGSDYQGLLPRAGGTMTGDIDMGTKKVLNLGLGTGLAAARVQELDLKAPIAAPQLTGDAQVNQDPTGNNSLTRRSWTEGRYAKLTGATLTGALVLAGNAAADLQAVPYQQLRDFVLFNTTAGHRHTGADARKIRGTDIDSGSAVANAPLLATGSGGLSTWGAALADPMIVLSGSLTQLFTHVTTQALTMVDVLSTVGSKANAALLMVKFRAVSSVTDQKHLVLALRADGAGSASSYYTQIDTGATASYEHSVQLWVPLSSLQRFQYQVTVDGAGTGTVSVTAWLQGWANKVL